MFHDYDLQKQGNRVWYTALGLTTAAVVSFMLFAMNV
jgi:hypothetical protein